MKTYYIYHIPNYKWKNGSIGKIGCTYRLTKRMRDQKTNNFEILETHSDIYIASNREIELQKQYGYLVDKKPYWKTLKMQTKESRIKGGLTSGRNNVDNGQIHKARNVSNQVRRKAILQYSKNGTFIREWNSGVEIERELNLDNSSITKVCKGKAKTCGGFIFKYK